MDIVRSWRLTLFAALFASLPSAASRLNGLGLRLATELAFAPQKGLMHALRTMQETDKTFKKSLRLLCIILMVFIATVAVVEAVIRLI